MRELVGEHLDAVALGEEAARELPEPLLQPHPVQRGAQRRPARRERADGALAGSPPPPVAAHDAVAGPAAPDATATHVRRAEARDLQGRVGGPPPAPPAAAVAAAVPRPADALQEREEVVRVQRVLQPRLSPSAPAPVRAAPQPQPSARRAAAARPPPAQPDRFEAGPVAGPRARAGPVAELQAQLEVVDSAEPVPLGAGRGSASSRFSPSCVVTPACPSPALPCQALNPLASATPLACL